MPTKKFERLANVILVATGAYLTLILMLLASSHGMALRYAVAGVGALGLFATLQMNASVKINITVVVLASVVSIFICDLVLAVAASSSSNFEVTRWLTFPNDPTPESVQARLQQSSKEKPAFDRRDKLQVIRDLDRQGVSAHPAVVPHAVLTWRGADSQKFLRGLFIDGAETVPMGGISNVLTVFCNESGEYVTYTSDEHGFHNPPGLWKQPQVEVVAVGDSFTHGACVPSEDNFVGVIRARHPATLNLGMDSNGPLLMLASLKEYAQRARPKVVLWFYFEGNDLKDMEHEMFSPILRRYLTDGPTQGLLDRQGEIDSALMTYIEQTRQNLGTGIEWGDTIRLKHLRQALASWYQQDDVEGTGLNKSRTYFSSEVGKEEMNQFRSVLTEANATVSASGGRLYFVYLPEWARYADPEFANKNRESVLRVVSELALPLIDLHPVFAGLPDPLEMFPFRQSNHYNSAGHLLVGEHVLRALQRMEGTEGQLTRDMR